MSKSLINFLAVVGGFTLIVMGVDYYNPNFVDSIISSNSSSVIEEKEQAVSTAPVSTAPVSTAPVSSTENTINDYIAQDSAMYLSVNIAAFNQQGSGELLKRQITDAIAELSQPDMQMDMNLNNVALLDKIAKALFTEDPATSLSVNADGQMAVYLSGLMPVMRLSINDAAQFHKGLQLLLQDVEAEVEAKVLVGSETELNMITIDEASLVITQIEQFAVIALVPKVISDSQLERVLGLQKPEQSIVSAGILQADAKAYGFNNQQLFSLNMLEVIKALVAADANQLAKDLATFVPDSDFMLASLRTQQCKDELTAFATAMPRLLAGQTSITEQEGVTTIKGKSILELKKVEVLAELKKLKGNVAPFVTDVDNNMFSLGLGLDVSDSLSALTALWNMTQNTQYDCEPLLEMQQELASLNPAMAGMGLAFVPGAADINGISLSLMNIDIDLSELMVTGQPTINAVDMILSVMTDTPQQLAQLLLQVPTLELDDEVTVNGEPVVASSMMAMGVIGQDGMLGQDIYVKAHDKSLSVYTGQQAAQAVTSLAKAKKSNDDMLSASFNVSKMLGLIQSLSPMYSQIPQDMCEPMQMQVDSMQTSNSKVLLGFSFTDAGFEINQTQSLQPGEYDITLCP